MAPSSYERASAADLMQLATGDSGAAAHIGAILVLNTAPGFSLADAQRLLGERIGAVPRLRQRLYRTPPGWRRPYWADDPAFDVHQHVRQLNCPQPGDERALLDLAAAELSQPLPRSRPPWSATFVTGLADGSVALLMVMDHVLADGVAGLAVLSLLIDQSDQPSQPDHVTRQSASGLRRIRGGIAELGGSRLPRRQPVTSLNQPVGPRRRLDALAVDLAAVRHLGHAHGATVNDMLLAAIAGALRTVLASRGEQLDEIAITVPVAGRQAGSRHQLGNQIGIMPVTVPATGALAARVTRTAEITRAQKTRARGASAALVVPMFLLLARTGLLRWFTRRQRLVNTFVTNLRGPTVPLTFGGAAVRAIIPIPSTTGNVTVTFAALSYAGTLRITVLSDPAGMPDAPVLTAALRRELTAHCTSTA